MGSSQVSFTGVIFGVALHMWLISAESFTGWSNCEGSLTGGPRRAFHSGQGASPPFVREVSRRDGGLIKEIKN